MIIKKVNDEPDCYHFFIDEEMEIFLTQINENTWVASNLISTCKNQYSLVVFLRKVLRWFDENKIGDIICDVKDFRFLKLLNKMGFGVSEIHLRRIKNEKETKA